jgi:haloacetate dehalogenase
MDDLADLFHGFSTHWIDTTTDRFFVRTHGDGTPLLLLHGYPQTHVEWHKIAAKLAEHFFVVLMDLRGYGWSSAPGSENGELY